MKQICKYLFKLYNKRIVIAHIKRVLVTNGFGKKEKSQIRTKSKLFSLYLPNTLRNSGTKKNEHKRIKITTKILVKTFRLLMFSGKIETKRDFLKQV